MEYIDIVDGNNNLTGISKGKEQAHEQGEFHRTVHIWILNDKDELLLQKRSPIKKSHPNCWDISCAGHIKSKETVFQGALRELDEELGLKVTENELKYIKTIKSTKNPKNMEFQSVFLLRCNKNTHEYIFRDNEVSKIKYIYFEELEKMVNERVEGLLIHEEEYRALFEHIRNTSGKEILNNFDIRRCTENDVDEIYDIQNIIIDNFKDNEKGYFLPFKKESYLRIINNPITDGEIYGAFVADKMVARIFLSVSNRMEKLKEMIPNLHGSCADIDGVIVLPDYRGYGLQNTLVKYLEKRAIEREIDNIVAEVTIENIYSLRNLKKLGYEVKTMYQKDGNINRYILLKEMKNNKI